MKTAGIALGLGLVVGIGAGFAGSLLLLGSGAKPQLSASTEAPGQDDAGGAEVARLRAMVETERARAEGLQSRLADAQWQLRDAQARATAAAASDPGEQTAAIDEDGTGTDAEPAQRRGWRGDQQDEVLTTEQIMALMGSEDVRERMRALRSLHLLADKGQAFSWALQQLKTSDANWLVMQAMEALTRIDPAQAIVELTPYLTDTDSRLATMAVRQLREIGDANALAALRMGLQSPEERVRLETALAMKRMGDASGIGTIGQKATADMSSTDGGVREQAVRTLASLGDITYNVQLVGVLSDSNSEVRKAAAEALGTQGTNSEIPALQALLSDPQPSVARSAERAIRMIENPELRERRGGRGQGGWGGGGGGGGGRGGRDGGGGR